MEVKVVKRFRDKHTNEIHKVNDVLTINKTRFKEILKVGAFVEEVNEDNTKSDANVEGNADTEGNTDAESE
jgi:hypothetical protein